MALDIANGWLRHDGASASSQYYGYNLDTAADDSDTTWSIRQVSEVGGIETVKWTNGSIIFNSSWTNRVNSFIAPTASLGLTFSKSQVTNGWILNLEWNILSGVDEYQISLRDENDSLLTRGAEPWPTPNQYQRNYSEMVYNKSSFNGLKVFSGNTYSISVTAINVAGSTTSTITQYFS